MFSSPILNLNLSPKGLYFFTLNEAQTEGNLHFQPIVLSISSFYTCVWHLFWKEFWGCGGRECFWVTASNVKKPRNIYRPNPIKEERSVLKPRGKVTHSIVVSLSSPFHSHLTTTPTFQFPSQVTTTTPELYFILFCVVVVVSSSFHSLRNGNVNCYFHCHESPSSVTIFSNSIS
jgi:hypothetical protein